MGIFDKAKQLFKGSEPVVENTTDSGSEDRKKAVISREGTEKIIAEFKNITFDMGNEKMKEYGEKVVGMAKELKESGALIMDTSAMDVHICEMIINLKRAIIRNDEDAINGTLNFLDTIFHDLRVEIVAENDLAKEEELRKRNLIVEQYATICTLYDQVGVTKEGQSELDSEIQKATETFNAKKQELANLLEDCPILEEDELLYKAGEKTITPLQDFRAYMDLKKQYVNLYNQVLYLKKNAADMRQNITELSQQIGQIEVLLRNKTMEIPTSLIDRIKKFHEKAKETEIERERMLTEFDDLSKAFDVMMKTVSASSILRYNQTTAEFNEIQKQEEVYENAVREAKVRKEQEKLQEQILQNEQNVQNEEAQIEEVVKTKIIIE